jgi:hypothetical protein
MVTGGAPIQSGASSGPFRGDQDGKGSLPSELILALLYDALSLHRPFMVNTRAAGHFAPCYAVLIQGSGARQCAEPCWSPWRCFASMG